MLQEATRAINSAFNNSFIKTPVSDIKYIEVSDHKLIVNTISIALVIKFGSIFL